MKKYILLRANNYDKDIKIEGFFDTKKEAHTAMVNHLKEILNKKAEHYIYDNSADLLDGNTYLYWNIKKIAV